MPGVAPADLIGLVMTAGAWWVCVPDAQSGPFADLESAFDHYLTVAPPPVERPSTASTPPIWWNHTVRRWTA